MLHSAIVMKINGAIHGRGLCATELIRKGAVLWVLDEPTFTWEEVKTWPVERFRAFRTYGIQCGVDRYALEEGLSREANHSCDPNTWWANSDTIIARRDILEDEEITYDYATSDIDLELDMECQCGAPRCRGRITNRDYLDPGWQEQYGANLPFHALAAIEKARK
jgi:hypothetical protein